jgi:hypothetical protein
LTMMKLHKIKSQRVINVAGCLEDV